MSTSSYNVTVRWVCYYGFPTRLFFGFVLYVELATSSLRLKMKPKSVRPPAELKCKNDFLCKQNARIWLHFHKTFCRSDINFTLSETSVFIVITVLV